MLMEMVSLEERFRQVAFAKLVDMCKVFSAHCLAGGGAGNLGLAIETHVAISRKSIESGFWVSETCA
jgi:hypothetical protein